MVAMTDEPPGHFPRTRIFLLGEDEHADYIDLLVAQWRHLDWRHAGFGALQAYIAEETTDHPDELRVHVWHPSLVRPGIAESGLCHDHRFDMRSVVLAGRVCQVEVDAVRDAGGDWQTSRVVHAREAMARSGSFHMAPEPTGERYHRSLQRFWIATGTGYRFPRYAFHETHVEAPTVTLVRKSNQSDARARILHPHGAPVVNAFEQPQSPAEFAGALADGLAALRSAAALL